MAEEEVRLLRGELRRVEQDIKAAKQELREARNAKDSPEIIADLVKDRDRLIEYQNSLLPLLGAQQAHLASPAGEVQTTARC